MSVMSVRVAGIAVQMPGSGTSRPRRAGCRCREGEQRPVNVIQGYVRAAVMAKAVSRRCHEMPVAVLMVPAR